MTDRYGPRIIISIGLLMFGIGMFCLTLVDRFPVYFLTVIIISVGISLGGYQTTDGCDSKLVQPPRTKAIALTQFGHSLGGLSVPVLAYGMEQFGWRTIVVATGFTVILLGIPLVQNIRHRPEEKDELVDGKIIGKNYNDGVEKNYEIISASWQNALELMPFGLSPQDTQLRCYLFQQYYWCTLSHA